MIGVFEEIILVGKKTKKVKAKIDTGAWRTSIDKSLIKELGFEKIGKTKKVKSSLGREEREIYKVSFLLKNKRIDTHAFCSDRKNLKYKVIIGRRDLKGFNIKVR